MYQKGGKLWWAPLTTDTVPSAATSVQSLPPPPIPPLSRQVRDDSTLRVFGVLPLFCLRPSPAPRAEGGQGGSILPTPISLRFGGGGSGGGWGWGAG